jgi:hypothetical protein
MSISCLTSHLTEYRKLYNQEIKNNIQLAQSKTYDWQINYQNQNFSETNIIPLVLHVISTDEAEYISDDQIKAQIEYLNQAFKEVNIEFCLASIDPNGLPTTGISHLKRYGELIGK